MNIAFTYLCVCVYIDLKSFGILMEIGNNAVSLGVHVGNREKEYTPVLSIGALVRFHPSTFMIIQFYVLLNVSFGDLII